MKSKINMQYLRGLMKNDQDVNIQKYALFFPFNHKKYTNYTINNQTLGLIIPDKNISIIITYLYSSTR